MVEGGGGRGEQAWWWQRLQRVELDGVVVAG